ncbi:MAG TPA: hypothetical protein VEC76_13710 [Streptosporangiaceae bacterium]|nr:hypothetical protein [Streptosporangiaceae bacterium]
MPQLDRKTAAITGTAPGVSSHVTGGSPFRSWPPPTSGNPSADCLGVINDAAEFALWLSPHILANTGRVLATVVKTRGVAAAVGRDGAVRRACWWAAAKVSGDAADRVDA